METQNGEESHSQGGIPDGEERVRGPKIRLEEKGICPKAPARSEKSGSPPRETREREGGREPAESQKPEV